MPTKRKPLPICIDCQSACEHPCRIRCCKCSRAWTAFTVRAQSAVTAAIKRGAIVRQPCEQCGQSPAEAHHDDYSKPMEVRWLCKPHHKQFHAAANRPAA